MLRVLARIARLVRHGDFLDDLRLAATPDSCRPPLPGP